MRSGELARAVLETRLRSKVVDIDGKLAALTELRDSLVRLLCERCARQPGRQACSALVQHRYSA